MTNLLSNCKMKTLNILYLLTSVAYFSFKET